jgi:hypothetical protein|tara:strand:+ start:157 stop:1479 length:1323 start_codon:yes stop_codon:yes gene_type:complete
MQVLMDNQKQYKKQWFDFMGYKPHLGQRKLHFPDKKTARFFVMVCGRRFGKTTASAMEATYYASQPNKKIWLVGLSYDKADLMFREVWQKMVVGRANDIERASEKERYIKFKWGTTVEAKSADNPDSLVGEGLDLLIMDEVAKMKRKIWDMYLSPTLSDRKGKGIFITTPEGFNWIYDLFLLGKQDDLWESHQAPTWDNDVVFPDGKKDQFLIERKRNMSKELYEQEYGAMFTSFEGRVYPFDRNLDMGEFPYNPNFPTFCSIDFGFRMPAALWFQTYMVGGVPHINVIDEIVHKQNIKTDEFIEMIKSKRYAVREYYGDPAGMQAQGQSGLGDIEIFRRNGVHVKSVRDKVSRNIASGITHVRGFIENAQGQRFVHLDRKCMGLAEDLENYRYPESGEGKDLKPDPVKDGRHDHSMDAFRYFFLNRFPIRQRELGVIKR